MAKTYKRFAFYEAMKWMTDYSNGQARGVLTTDPVISDAHSGIVVTQQMRPTAGTMSCY